MLLLLCLAVPLVHALSGTFLQLTDLHVDALYRNRSVPGVPSGCHAGQGGAGVFGDRCCDTPLSLARGVLAGLAKSSPWPDFVLVTGDLTRHTDRYVPAKKSAADVLEELGYVADMLLRTFPNVSFVPVLGNNDAWPYKGLPIKAFYEGAAAQLRPLLQQSDLTTFAEGAYFVRKVSPALWLVAVNSIVWRDSDLSGPAECGDDGSEAAAHMAWLDATLASAPVSVYIVGHVPPVNWSKSCAKKYAKSVRTHSAGRQIFHIYGHKHSDQFYLHDEDGKKQSDCSGGGFMFPVLIAPSLMPEFNPAVRRYRYTPSTGLITDFTQLFVQLDGLNERAPPSGLVVLETEYTFSKAYGISGPLNATYMCKLADLLHEDANTKATYNVFKSVSSPTQDKCPEAE